MAIKSALFLLAFVLLATRMASSLEDVDATLNEHHHHNHSKAHAPTKEPTHPPVFHHLHFCDAKCEKHCKDLTPKKECKKACNACCAKFKCVPDGSKNYCNNWDGVVIHGKNVKCPRRN